MISRIADQAISEDADAVMISCSTSVAPESLRKLAWALEGHDIKLLVSSRVKSFATGRATVQTDQCRRHQPHRGQQPEACRDALREKEVGQPQKVAEGDDDHRVAPGFQLKQSHGHDHDQHRAPAALLALHTLFRRPAFVAPLVTLMLIQLHPSNPLSAATVVVSLAFLRPPAPSL